MGNKHLVIVRTGGSVIDFESYNCQELGLAKALACKGFRVSLIFAGEENRKFEVRHQGCRIDVYRRRFKCLNQALAWFDDLAGLLDELQPDLLQIHEFGMMMSWQAVRWSKRRNVPTVLIQGSYRPTQKPLFKQLEQMFNLTLGRYVLSKVKAVGCKTLFAADYVRTYSDCRIFSTPVGIDLSKFDEKENVDWRKRLGIPSDKKILLYIGVLEQRRNPHFLIDVVSRLSDEYVLVIVGDGPRKEEIVTRINNEQLQARCLPIGKLPQKVLPSLYGQADLFMLASDYEIFGMVILESMNFSLPVISTRTAGSATVIETGVDGIVMDSMDSKKWADEIKRLLDDEAVLSQMRQKAADKIKSSFTWNKTSDKFIELYAAALKDC